MILETGETCDLTEKLNKSGSVQETMTWESADESVAKVDKNGVITAGSVGQTRITGTLPTGQVSVSYAVAVEKQGSPDTSKGTSHKVSGSTYKVLGKSTVALTKAKNVKTVTVPATVKIGGKTFKVTQINAKAFTGKNIRTVTIGKNVKTIKAGAFKGSKATRLTVKTKKLTKKSVKGSLKGSKIRTVKVSLGKKSVNRKYVKKYKKIFTRKNAGRKASVK